MDGVARVHSATSKTDARVGAMFIKGDKLLTSTGEVVLSCDHSKQMLSIGPNSRLIKTPSTDFSFRLEEGEVSSLVAPDQDKLHFEIRTPNAIAAVRGTFFRTQHTSHQTLVQNLEGQILVQAVDEKGQPRGKAVLLTKSKKMNINAQGLIFGPRALSESESQLIEMTRNRLYQLQQSSANGSEVREKQANDSDPTQATIIDVSNAHYIVSSCELQNQVCPCPDAPYVKPERKEIESQLEDAGSSIGDSLEFPVRFMLSWNDSKLSIDLKGTTVAFEGAMIVCLEKNLRRDRYLIKIFQAGNYTSSVTYSNGATHLNIKSANENGLQTSSVNLDEGEVSVTMPWLCESCGSQQSFLLKPGECYIFDTRAVCSMGDNPSLPEILQPVANDINLEDPFL
jgi:hypothetical protein